MLKLIYGASGSGKTYYTDNLIIEALSKGKTVTLLVPEQEVMEAERRIADRADQAGVLCEKLSVVSFRRLANLAFRKYGGIEYRNLSEGGRMLLLWSIIEELSSYLSVYKNNRDRSLIELMYSVCNELKRYCITPTMLSSLAEKTTDTSLKNKLLDISMVYSLYTDHMKYEYSDPTDDVVRLSEILKTEPFLEDTVLFLDSFNGFTTPELNCIEYAITKCDVTVTLCLSEKKGRTGFVTVEKTEKALLNMAAKRGVPCDQSTHLTPLTEYLPSEFRLVEEKLFDFSFSSPADYSSDKITLAKCVDHFAQAEFIAINICKLVRNGARYRDIAVINRNPESYEGVLDVIFEKYDIPLFLSKRSKLTDTAIYKTIICALDILQDGFRTESVMTYIKYGLCGLSAYETDLIESYTSAWNITGKRWIDEFEWNMNPAGFTDIYDEKRSAILDEINAIRKRICDPLLDLKENIISTDLKSACAAIYRFISESGIYEHFLHSDDPSEITAYNTFMSLLDNCVTAIGELTVTPSVLSSLLYLSAKNTDFGKIPATFDRVIAGDASILRVNGCKHVFLTDCENGVFPKAASDDSFFNETEKAYLNLSGIELSPNLAEQNDAEMFSFLRAACGASETLTATYCLNDGKAHPSVGFIRLTELFPGNKIIFYPKDYTAYDKIQTPKSSKEAALSSANSPIFKIINNIYEELSQPLLVSDEKISQPINTVSEQTVSELFGKRINLTQSRIESYVKCPFSYYCTYVLKLGEKKHEYFRASDMGTYIHRILELAVSEIYGKNFEGKDITEEDITTITEKAILSVLSYILGDQKYEDMRLEALTERLKKTVTLLIRNIVAEFQNSSFKPKHFEFRISNESGCVPPLKFRLPDETEISITGVIDRVDTYEKDGKAYIRVVDYKTGSHEHSLANIAYGIDMQMYLYLFAICAANAPNLLGIDDQGITELIPAGVLYQPSKLKITKTNHPSEAEKALSYCESNLVRSGALLKDHEILNAMEKDLTGRFIPVKMKNEVLVSSAVSLKTLEEFGTLLSDIEDKIKTIGSTIKMGNASATPMKNKVADACKYCKMYPICRSNK